MFLYVGDMWINKTDFRCRVCCSLYSAGQAAIFFVLAIRRPSRPCDAYEATGGRVARRNE
eukprot:906623-Pyramimonas_sp.AAC.2